MNSPLEMSRPLVLLVALAASACACKGRPGSEPGSAPSAIASTCAAPAGSGLALWEPVDKQFTGCEGG
ncbi:MAG: hypothetical protein ABJE95_36685 [Byssovorax sp.]